MKNNKVKFCVYGVLFGILFPVIGTMIVAWENQNDSMGLIDLHLGNRLLMIIDTAPFFLGLFSFLVGKAVDEQLQAQDIARREAEQRQQEREQAAKILQERNEKLLELNQALDALVYTASHDLKTPVVNFQAMLKMLRTVRERPGSEAMVEEIITRMEGAARKFQLTISDLLDVSRLEKQASEGAETIQVRALGEEILSGIDEVVKKSGAEVVLDIPEEAVVHCSKPALESVMMNLITNAIKYRHPERQPAVRIWTAQEGDKIDIHVEDNGSGIDMEKHGQKLFRMFTRLVNGGEGSGIGLYIVKRTVDLMGGNIHVKSQLSVGSTFTVSLPVHQPLT